MITHWEVRAKDGKYELWAVSQADERLYAVFTTESVPSRIAKELNAKIKDSEEATKDS